MAKAKNIDPNKSTKNHMAKVKCPIKDTVMWANSTSKGGYRCTGCGQPGHDVVTR